MKLRTPLKDICFNLVSSHDIDKLLCLDEQATFVQRNIPSLHAPPRLTYEEIEQAVYKQDAVYGVCIENAAQWCGYVWIEKREDTLFLSALVLDAAVRGKGVGYAVMQWVLQQAQSRGCSRIQLTVEPYNTPARALYEKCGFVIQDHVVAYFGKTHPYTHRLLMCLSFGSVQK
jgi:GNAT superfamily N-acetyltransferase